MPHQNHTKLVKFVNPSTKVQLKTCLGVIVIKIFLIYKYFINKCFYEMGTNYSENNFKYNNFVTNVFMKT